MEIDHIWMTQQENSRDQEMCDYPRWRVEVGRIVRTEHNTWMLKERHTTRYKQTMCNWIINTEWMESQA